MPNILSPKSGQAVQGNIVELIVATPNYKIVDFEKYTKASPGTGHLHIWVDQTNFSKASAIKSASNIYKLSNLAPGPHTVTVELVSNNHSSFIPRNISSVSFATTPLLPEKPKSPLLLTLITLVLLLIAAYLMLSKPKPTKKSKK